MPVELPYANVADKNKSTSLYMILVHMSLIPIQGHLIGEDLYTGDMVEEGDVDRIPIIIHIAKYVASQAMWP